MDLVADVHARVDDLGGANDAEERDLFATLFRAFADRCPEAVRRIEDAASAGDPARVGYAAHALKGSAANVGAHAAAAVCAHLEEAARRGNIPTSAELARLREEVTAAAAVLSDIATDFATTVLVDDDGGEAGLRRE